MDNFISFERECNGHVTIFKFLTLGGHPVRMILQPKSQRIIIDVCDCKNQCALPGDFAIWSSCNLADDGTNVNAISWPGFNLAISVQTFELLAQQPELADFCKVDLYSEDDC